MDDYQWIEGAVAVAAVLQAGRRDVAAVEVRQDRYDSAAAHIQQLARAAGVPLARVPAGVIDERLPDGAPSGIIARVGPRRLLSLVELLAGPANEQSAFSNADGPSPMPPSSNEESAFPNADGPSPMPPSSNEESPFPNADGPSPMRPSSNEESAFSNADGRGEGQAEESAFLNAGGQGPGRAGPPRVLVMLDGVEDPFNFGQAVRSLYAAGIDGLIVRPRNWLSAAATVIRASAGASEWLPTAAAEIAEVIAAARAHTVPIVIAEAGGRAMHEVDLTGPLLLIIGGEKRGVARPLREAAAARVSIPYGREFPQALGTAAAAAVLGFEVARQRRARYP